MACAPRYNHSCPTPPPNTPARTHRPSHTATYTRLPGGRWSDSSQLVCAYLRCLAPRREHVVSCMAATTPATSRRWCGTFTRTPTLQIARARRFTRLGRFFLTRRRAATRAIFLSTQPSFGRSGLCVRPPASNADAREDLWWPRSTHCFRLGQKSWLALLADLQVCRLGRRSNPRPPRLPWVDQSIPHLQLHR